MNVGGVFGKTLILNTNTAPAVIPSLRVIETL